MKSSIRAAALALAFTGAAVAADRLVPQDFPTIQSAINASAAGDVIKVMPGTYAESLTISGKSLTIQCASSASKFSIAPASGRGLIVDAVPSPGLRVVGMKVTNATAPDVGAGMKATGSIVRLESCEFRGCTIPASAGTRSGAGLYAQGGQVTLTGCEFVACAVSATTTASTGSVVAMGGGLMLQGAPGTIQGCRFDSCTAFAQGSGTWTEVHANGGGACAFNCVALFDDCSFVNNRAETNATGSGAVGRSVGGGVAIAQASGTGSTVQKCRFYGNSTKTNSTNTTYSGAGESVGGAVGVGFYENQLTTGAHAVTQCTLYGNHADQTPLTGTGALAGDIGAWQRETVTVSTCRVGGSYTSNVTAARRASMLRANTTYGAFTLTGTTFCGVAGATYGSDVSGSGNTTLAQCTDCNSDGNPDFAEIALGAADSDANGIPDACQGAVIVTVPGQYPTIQAAIDAAPATTPWIISVAAGTYGGPIDFKGKNVIVRGAGAGLTIIAGISGQTSSVIRMANEPATAALERVTVQWGYTGTPFPGTPSALCGGAIFANTSSAAIRDCDISNNGAGYGGGIYLLTCTSTIERCAIRGNSATSGGGGLQFYGGRNKIIDTLIEDNRCTSVGAGIALGGVHELTRVTIRNNIAQLGSGGIWWTSVGQGPNSPAMLTITDCVVTGNSVLSGTFGGISILSDSVMPWISLQGTQVCGNTPRPNVDGRWIDLGGNTICDCVGDLTADGQVNGADLGSLLSGWGVCGTTCPGDLNRDGIINGFDLGLLLANWGPCAP